MKGTREMIRRLGLIGMFLLVPLVALAQVPTPIYQAPWSQVGARVTLAASASSSRVALGWSATGQRAPLSVWVHNPSTTVSAYIVPGDGSVVATTDGILVAPGADVTVALGGGTNLAAITDGGSVTLSIASGNGTPLARGGGTSGGGGGGSPSGSAGDIQTYATSSTFGHITPGTGVATALAVNVGTAGSPVVNGGALGTPSSGTGTNISGIPLSGLLSQATNTVLGNATAGSASPTALSVGSCSTAGSALKWMTDAGFGCNTAIDAATLGGNSIGTSGATIPLNNGNNTKSGTQTFTGAVIGPGRIVSGTTDGPTASDCGATIHFTSGSSITVTMPNSITTLECTMTFIQEGAGQITFAAASQATIHSRSSFTKTAGQWAVVDMILNTNSDGTHAVYTLAGDGA